LQKDEMRQILTERAGQSRAKQTAKDSEIIKNGLARAKSKKQFLRRTD